MAADLPDNIVSALKTAGVSDSGYITPSDVRTTITDYMISHWRDVITPQIVGVDRHRRLALYAACSELSPLQYLEFLQRGRKLSEDHVIDDKEFISLVTPSPKKEVFLTVNLRNPAVHELYEYNEMVLLRAGYHTAKLSDLDEDDLIKQTREQISPQALASIELPKFSGSRLKLGNEQTHDAGSEYSGSAVDLGSKFFGEPRNWALLVALGLLAVGAGISIRRFGREKV